MQAWGTACILRMNSKVVVLDETVQVVGLGIGGNEDDKRTNACLEGTVEWTDLSLSHRLLPM